MKQRRRTPRDAGKKRELPWRSDGDILGISSGGSGWRRVLVALPGCSASPDRESSLDDATVTGTVKVRGKLLEGGELHFHAVNPNRRVDRRNAAIGKDGTFTVKTYIGRNLVTVTPPKPRNKKEGQDFFGVNSEELSVDVKPDENSASLEFLP